MGCITGMLIDTVSIQQYVYSGNRLKENIGASNIVRDIYKDWLGDALKAVLGHRVMLEDWSTNPKQISIYNSDVDFEVGYIGGGKALLFFRDRNRAVKFIRQWTEKLLLEAPGLNTAFALADFNFKNFCEELDRLHKELEINKNRYFPQTHLPKHGITADCPLTGLSAEVFFTLEKDGAGDYISSAAYAKYLGFEDDRVKSLVEEKSGGKYTCTSNINKLGQSFGKGHIAIVHMDGNAMGEKFKACKDLIDIRNLSVRLGDIMDNAYDRFLDYVIGLMDYFLEKKNGFDIEMEDGKYIIPFRPILVEGDDITFITDGRLGLPFAEKYLELVSGDNLPGNKKMSACAGVAITRTKYPFFRGYTLAEELCQSAKASARELKNNEGRETSWIDFHIAYGGFSGSLEEIMNKRYTVNGDRLHFGPYLVICGDMSNERNIGHLKEGIKQFKDPEKWPRSVVKRLRDHLTLGENAPKHFMDEATIMGRELHSLSETGRGYGISLWRNGYTPYFDAIELMDLYPDYFLNGGK
ncbi:MAG: hypothetical protein GX352_02380 [Clostridiales bacterium]|nr:hypothetical protein [Clostridiales bacterium]